MFHLFGVISLIRIQRDDTVPLPSLFLAKPLTYWPTQAQTPA